MSERWVRSCYGPNVCCLAPSPRDMLRRCAAHTRASDPASSAPLPPRETRSPPRRRPRPALLLADVPHSAAARDYYTTSIPHRGF